MGFTNIVGNAQGTLGAINNIAQSVLSLFGVDVVGIYDNDTFEQLFQTARPMKANINRSAKIMEHPIETGSVVQDFMIIQPVDIELSMVLASDGEYQAVYQAIKGYFLSGTQVSIDAIPLAIKLRQIQMVTVQYQALTASNVQQPQDQSTVQTGAQQPQQSALYQIGSFLGGIFN